MIQAVSLTGVKINLMGFRNNKDGWVTLSFQFHKGDGKENCVIREDGKDRLVCLLDAKHALEDIDAEYPEGMGVLTFGIPTDEAEYYIDGERSDVPAPMY